MTDIIRMVPLHGLVVLRCLLALLPLSICPSVGLGSGTKVNTDAVPVIMATGIVAPKAAATLVLSADETAWVAAHPVIRAGGGNNFPPLDFAIGGRSQGYTIDLLNLLAQRIGLQVEYVTGPTWSEHLELHKQGKLDLLHTIYRTPAREKIGHFTEPFYRSRNVFVTRNSEADIADLAQLNGKTVAVGKGWAQEEFLASQYPGIKRLTLRNMEELLDAVSSGKADATFANESSLNYLMQKKLLGDLKLAGWVREFDQRKPQSFHFFARQDAPQLATLLDKAMASLTPEDLRALQAKWFGAGATRAEAHEQRVRLTDDERSYLSRKGVIRMCVLPDWPPYEQINAKGQHEGISAEMIALMRSRLGVEFALHPTRDWNESVAGIRERKCDILPLAVDLPARRDAMDFTRPYITAPFVVATHAKEFFIKDSSEIGEREVGIVKGYAFLDLLKQRRPATRIVEVDSARDGLDRVRRGELWGYIDVLPVIAHTLQKYSMLELKIAGKLEFDLEDSLATRNDEPLLAAIMQKATDSISEDERRAIIDKSVAIRYEQGVDYGLIWKIAGASGLILGVVFLWNRRLAKLNRALDQAQSTLRKTSNELQTIFDNAWIGVFITNGERKVQRMNRFAESELFRCAPGAYIGESTRRFFSSQEEFEAFARDATAANATNVTIETRLNRRDGSPFLARAIGSLVDPADRSMGAIWLVTDVTEQRAAEERLALALKELEIIFGNVGIGIVYLKDRRMVRVNKAFADMLGYGEADLIGKSTRIYHPTEESYEIAGGAYATLTSGQKTFRSEMPIRRADGSVILCENVGSLVDPGDPSKGSIWIHRDITELRRTQAQLQDARDDALAKNEVIQSTLAKVAALLNNSGQGFLSFASDLKVDEGFSQECRRIFRRDVLDLSLPELLCPHDSKQRALVTKTLPLAIDCSEDALRRDAYLSLLPSEYRLHGSYFKAEYKPLVDQRMMLVLTDVSDQRSLAEKLAQERARLEYVVNALENRDDLLEVINDFEAFRSRILPDLLSFEHRPHVLLSEVLRPIHTFKSLFAQSNLPSVPTVLHELESRLAELNDMGERLDVSDIKRVLGVIPIGPALDADLSLLREKLGDDYFSSERMVRVPASKLAKLEDQAGALYGVDSRMLALVRQLRFVPLAELITPHFRATEQLAARQGKSLAPMSCVGDLAHVDPDVHGAFCKSLVHVFRNAVDHGIEDPDSRLLADKDETATIRCSVQTDVGRLTIAIEDDGKGVDVDAVKARALATGLISVETAATIADSDVFDLIFSEGLSTRSEVSDISGRGIGLSAVRQELDRLGGHMHVESEPGRRTRLEFTLPYLPTSLVSMPTAAEQRANQFLSPLPSVVHAFCAGHLKLPLKLDPELREYTADALWDFTVLLSLGQKLHVTLGLSIERPLLLEMTRRFEPDFSKQDIESMADSVGAEVANTLFGNATVYFTHLIRHVALSTPEVVPASQRSERIGAHAFRGFEGRTEQGKFTVFCLLAEEA